MRTPSTATLVGLVAIAATMFACGGDETKQPSTVAGSLPGPLNVPPAAAAAAPAVTGAAVAPEVPPAVADAPSEVAPEPEPEPEPEPPIATYAEPKHNAPEGLVPAPLERYVAKRMAETGTDTLSALWGKGADEVPFLIGEEPEEVEDTRPWERTYVHRTGVGEGWRQLKASWRFLDDELFMVRLDYRRRGKKLLSKIQAIYGAAPVETISLRDGTVMRLWHDEGLVVGVGEHKGHHELLLAERGRYERFRRRLEPVDKAEHLVWGSLDQFYSPRTMNVRGALTSNLEAAELVPDFGDAWSNACHAAYQLGQLEEAAAYCDKALENTKEPSVRGEASYYKGLLAIARGDASEAKRLFALALAKVPRGWGITSDIKLRLAGLDGKPTEAMLERAVFDYWCAGHRDGDRQRRIPAEFGFSTYDALYAAADDELVDIEGAKTKAEEKCARR